MTSFHDSGMTWADLAQALLDEVASYFDEDQLPAVRYVSAGSPAFDYCSQLTVNVEASYTAAGQQLQNSACADYPILVFEIILTRCAPTSDGQTPPLPEILHEVGLQSMKDLQALIEGLGRSRDAKRLFGSWDQRCSDITIRGFQSDDDSGGMGSIRATVQLSLR